MTHEKIAAEIMRLFVHRSDVFAIQVKSGEGYIYVPKYEVLTEEDVQLHLDGKITLGVYQLDENNTVKWLCFDIDSAHVEKPEATRDLIYKRCVEQFGEDAVRIEESGTPRNFHVWVFFAEAVEARYARAVGLKVLVGLEHVELFPKQTALSGKGLGNLVKLPLGLHQKSGKWSRMSIEGVKPCVLDTTSIKGVEPTTSFQERQVRVGYTGRDPNCIKKIQAGVKKGARNNAGIVYASYLANLRNYDAERAFYLMRLWNRRNKPRLDDNELRSILKQALSGGYVFGCKHDYVKDYCEVDGCVFENADIES